MTTENKSDRDDLALLSSFMEKNAGNIHSTNLEDGEEMSLSHGKVWNLPLNPCWELIDTEILDNLPALQGRSDSSEVNMCRSHCLAQWGEERVLGGLPQHMHMRRFWFSFSRDSVRRSTPPSCDKNRQNKDTRVRSFWIEEGRCFWRVQAFLLKSYFHS